MWILGAERAWMVSNRLLVVAVLFTTTACCPAPINKCFKCLCLFIIIIQTKAVQIDQYNSRLPTVC